jgi:uncharacterized membrane protein YqiK
MPTLLQKPEFQLFALSTVGVLVLLTAFFVTLAKFYRRCGADEALVRTGAGGNKVVIGGGITVYPILHQLLRVSLHSIKLSVERSGKNALVTKDKIKANVTTELYIKVEPIAEDVLAAARSFGERNFDENAIGGLIEGKLTDALRSVSANQTFMELHGQRKQFAEHIQSTLSDELKKNGLTLENVSITALAMVPVKELDPHDVFDAEGLRAITDSVQTNAELTNRIQREKELAIQLTNAEARKRALTIEQDQKHAEADQARRVSEYAATQKAETSKAVYIQEQSQELAALEKRKATETGRIQQEQAIAVAEAARQRGQREAQIAGEKAQQAAEIAKQREIEAATIEKQKVVQAAEVDRQKALETASIDRQKAVESAEINKQQAVETARIAKQIAVTQSEELAARAAALKAQAEAEQQQAMQGIITVEETAKANREKAIAVIKSEEEAQQSRIAAEREAFKLKLEAETQAAIVKAHAEGGAAAKRAEAEGEVAKAQGLAKARELDAQASANVMRLGSEAKATAAAQEAQGLISLADATQKRGEAEADARRKMVEAENSVSTKFLLRDVAIKALDVLPAVARELMTPARAISEIKILQLQGGPGSGGTNSENGSNPLGNVASPILKTILEAGAAYPLMREMMSFAQVDGQMLADKARSFLNTLPAELRQTLEQDPAFAKKLEKIEASATKSTTASDIDVRDAEPATIPPGGHLPAS